MLSRVRLAWVLACLLAVGLGQRSASAAVDLTDVLNDGFFVVGDALVFDQFSFSSTGEMPSVGSLQLDALSDGSGNYGIRLFGGFVDTNGTAGPSTINFNYRVTPLNGAVGISAAMLAANPAVIGSGNFTITEDFDGIPTMLTVFDSGGGNFDLVDAMNLPSTVSALNVALSLVANSEVGAATASFVDQTFSLSSDNVVPEPASIIVWLGTLMLLGIVPVTYRRWNQVAQPMSQSPVAK